MKIYCIKPPMIIRKFLRLFFRKTKEEQKKVA